MFTLLLVLFRLFQFSFLLTSAQSTIAQTNRTFHPSATAVNITSSLLTYNTTLNDCGVSWSKFYESKDSYVNSLFEAQQFSTYVKTGTDYLTETDYSYVLYTLADGYPRLSTSFPTKTDVRTLTEVVTHSVLLSELKYAVTSPTSPSCYNTECDLCQIYAPLARLNYWPASTVAGYPNSTLPSKATEPQTVVVDGNTFTSPTVYIVYDGVVATGACGTVGAAHTNAAVGLRSEDVSIFGGYHNINGPERLNFSDFEGPVPFKCDRFPEANCFPIPPVYNPLLVLPEKIRDLDPAWKTCGIDGAYGAYDPPRLLEPAQALVGPTSTVDAVVTSAAPVPAPLVLSPGGPPTANLNPASPSPTGQSSSSIKIPNPNNPPAENPRTKVSPGKNTSTKDQPPKDPFRQDPPTQDPPARDSPAQDPPAQDPPAQDPPAQDPPARDPPAQDPPAKDFSTKAPMKIPSANDPAPVQPQASNVPELALDQYLKKQSVAAASLTPGPVVVFGSQQYTANSASQYIIEGQTLWPGSTITVAGSVLSAPAALIAGQAATLPAIVIGSKSYTANPASQYIIEGQTLWPGSTITVAGTVISAPAGQIKAPTPTLPAVIIGSKSYTANSADEYVIAGQTLSPGGTITVSGTVISAPVYPASASISGASFPKIVIGSKSFTANPAGQYIIASQTLSPGGKITVSGSVISAPNPAASTAFPVLTIGSQTLTANPAGQYLIAGETLTAGGTIHLPGQPVISLAPSATALIIGAVTEALVSPTRGLGAWIMHGFAGGSSTSNSTSSGVSGAGSTTGFTGVAYEGSAGQRRARSSAWLLVGLLVLPLIMDFPSLRAGG